MTRTGMRGVLRPGTSGQHYSLSRFPAPGGLEHVVEYLWVAEWDLREPYVAEVLPHPNINPCVMAGATRISGTGRKVLTQRLDGAGRVVGVTYRPGAFRLLHCRLRRERCRVGGGRPERPDWSRLAADLGYYDQSHLIRAFRAALGVTPEEYLRRCHEPT